MTENVKGKNKYGRTTRLTLNVQYTLSITSFLFSLFCYFQLEVQGVVFKSLLSFSVLNTINILLFYSHKSIIQTYIINAILGYVTLLFICFYSGGVNSPAISFLVLLIFFGYLMKKKYGDFWFFVVVSTVVILYLMDRNSYGFINEISVENVTEFNLLFLFFLIILLGGVFGRMISKTIEEVKKAKLEISKRNDEKTVMLREIHHRVKNNLQVVNSLLGIQARNVVDEKVKSMFRASQSRVVTMARLHEKIYNTQDLKNINVKEYFKILINDLVNSNSLVNNISLKLCIDPIDMSIDTLLPLSLIVNELVSNSLKHAFVDVDLGEVSVEFNLLASSQYRLLIQDNGTGSKGDLMLKSKKSTGMTLVRSFVKQLNGEIKLLNSTSGTCFELVFPGSDPS